MTYEPSRVLDNLIKMIHYREMTIVGDFSPEAALKTLAVNEYTAIYATREESSRRAETTAVIILVLRGSELTTTVGRFKALCNSIKLPTAGNFNVLICASNAVTSHIGREIVRLKTEGLGESPKMVPACKLRVEYYTHEDFALDKIRGNVMVDPHRIMSNAEVTEFCKLYSVTKDQFSILPEDDMQAVFLGVVAGQCVEVRRSSETSGESINVKQCLVAVEQQKK